MRKQLERIFILLFGFCGGFIFCAHLYSIAQANALDHLTIMCESTLRRLAVNLREKCNQETSHLIKAMQSTEKIKK